MQNNLLENVPAPKIQAKETLGAGDVWHGAFSLGLAEGKNEVDSIKFANLVASLKCKNFGGRDSFPNRQQVIDFRRSQI